MEVLPWLHARWGERDRPLPAAVARARRHYTEILALDGSTLDALQKKVHLSDALPERKGLAGRMAALLDVASHLPKEVWYEEESAAHDQTFWERALEAVSPGALLLFDLGFVNYGFYDRLTRKEVKFVTRLKSNALKSNAAFRVEQVLREGPKVRDCRITLGSGTTRCEETLRMVAVLYGGKWYRYLTNELDPDKLPTEHVVALYWQRWRIEDAYATVKRLLGLSYFATNSVNGIEIQLWASWVLYALLADLTDAVAQRLKQPYQMISVEMVYRGLAHFTRAFRRGAATDPAEYLAQKSKLLGIVKQKRPKSLDALHLLTTQLKA